MREILFRGKSPHKGWVYGYYWTNEVGNHFIRRAVRNDGNLCIEDVEVDPDTVGQYTGLVDKNGKQIFEGDILKSPASIWKVAYNSGMYILVNQNKQFISLNTFWVYCEVIGNIYDNPKLLEVEG